MKKIVLLLSLFALTTGISYAQYTCWVDINQTVQEGYTVSLDANYYVVDTITGDSVTTNVTYTWSYGGMTYPGSNFTYTFSGPGTYQVCVLAEAPECSADACHTVVIEEPDTTLTVSLDYYFATSSECSAVVTPEISGGTAPYTYDWSNGETGEIIDGICAGEEICLTVTDAASQVADDCVFIEWNVPEDSCDIYLSYDITPATNWNTPNGAIDISIYGGTEPYTFIWSTSTTNEDLVDVYPGEYTVNISDDAGCSLTHSFYVPVENDDSTGIDPYIVLEYYFADSLNNCSAVVTSEVIGGTAPYTYLWSNGETGEIIDGICAGEMVCLSVEDAMGEVADACITINETMPDDSLGEDPWESTIDTCIITGVIDLADISNVWVSNSSLYALWEIIMGSDTVDIIINYGEISEIEPGVYEFVLYINCGDYKSVTTLSTGFYISQSVLGVPEQETLEVSAYPNPVNDVLTIQTGQSDYDVNVQLMDVNGRTLQNNIIRRGNDKTTMHTGDLPSGMYFVNITCHGKQTVMKVIK
ncbi:MAG: T9SS type A sorting domain-containing protein [Bacteroidota bacterium]|nr:T9SS type A sorting domain-containing protein [Bacteroidota bacterium]